MATGKHASQIVWLLEIRHKKRIYIRVIPHFTSQFCGVELGILILGMANIKFIIELVMWWRKYNQFVIHTIPKARFAESRVLERSIDMVTGPMPPGTGVMADATFTASWKQTSPLTRKPCLLLGSCILYLTNCIDQHKNMFIRN